MPTPWLKRSGSNETASTADGSVDSSADEEQRGKPRPLEWKMDSNSGRGPGFWTASKRILKGDTATLCEFSFNDAFQSSSTIDQAASTFGQFVNIGIGSGISGLPTSPHSSGVFGEYVDEGELVSSSSQNQLCLTASDELLFPFDPD